MRRSAKPQHMIQEGVHQIPSLFSKDAEMGYAIREIPHLTFVLKDFEHAVTEDKQTRILGNLTELGGKFRLGDHADHRPIRRRAPWGLAPPEEAARRDDVRPQTRSGYGLSIGTPHTKW